MEKKYFVKPQQACKSNLGFHILRKVFPFLSNHVIFLIHSLRARKLSVIFPSVKVIVACHCQSTFVAWRACFVLL